jgi:hypothetical protein
MPCRRLLVLLTLIFASLASNGQTADTRRLIPREPTPNLGQLKTWLIAYHDCTGNQGCDTSDLDRQSDLALANLEATGPQSQAGRKAGVGTRY